MRIPAAVLLPVLGLAALGGCRDAGPWIPGGDTARVVTVPAEPACVPSLAAPCPERPGQDSLPAIGPEALVPRAPAADPRLAR